MHLTQLKLNLVRLLLATILSSFDKEKIDLQARYTHSKCVIVIRVLSVWLLSGLCSDKGA